MTDGSLAEGRNPALLRLPPPVMMALAFGVGAAIHHFLPLPAGGFGEAAFAAGEVLLALGFCLGAFLATGFLRRRTTLNPYGHPSSLVVGGPYRFSRNPMYLTLVTVYLGGTLMLGSIWPLATLVVPLAILSRVVIPFEEARMRATFGEAYREYCSRVRRWL